MFINVDILLSSVTSLTIGTQESDFECGAVELFSRSAGDLILGAFDSLAGLCLLGDHVAILSFSAAFDRDRVIANVVLGNLK